MDRDKNKSKIRNPKSKIETGLSIVFLLAFLLISAESAEACICPSPPFTPHSEFSRSAVVGLFKLKSKEKDFWVYDVKKVYKGNIKKGDKIRFANSGCSTPPGGPIGQDYLLYGAAINGLSDQFAIRTCSRSARSGWMIDRLWLDKLDKVKGQSRLAGEVWQEIGIDGKKWKSLRNWPLTIKGNGKVYSLTTNRKGIYEIYGLPPGVYEITPAPIKGYDYYHPHPPDYREEVERTIYRNSDDAIWNILFVVETSITGRLVDANGAALEGVEIVLRGRDDKDRRRDTGTKTVSGKNGYFELRTVPAGTFVIEVVGEWVTKRMPADGFYYSSEGYSSAGNFEKPTSITIKKGQIIKDLLIRAPKVGPR